MGTFQSTKVYDGFSCCFRQWKARTTHCRFLHGYGVSIKLWFEGDLDHRNWVQDFGGFKRSKCTIDGMSPKAYLDYMLDHTVIVAEDDPQLDKFKELDDIGTLRLRIVPAVGAERFAEFLYNKLQPFIEEDSNGRVRITQVEFREHDKNSAIYKS